MVEDPPPIVPGIPVMPTNAPYNLTLKQLAANTHSVLVGTSVDFNLLNLVGDPATTLLYGTVAGSEYNMIMEENVCSM